MKNTMVLIATLNITQYLFATLAGYIGYIMFFLVYIFCSFFGMVPKAALVEPFLTRRFQSYTELKKANPEKIRSNLEVSGWLGA